MRADVLAALLKRLRMAYNSLYAVKRRAFYAEQIMLYRKIDYLINEQIAREDKIHDRSDLAGSAVFKRQHHAVILAALDRAVRVAEIGIRDKLGLREHALCRHICKRALNAAVGHAHAV